MENKKKTVISISIGSYPLGTATSARNMALLKGMRENGYDVLLISLYPDKNQDKLSNSLEGIYNSVPFIYTTKDLTYRQNKIKQYFVLLYSIFRCKKLIRKNYHKDKTVIINQISNPFLSLLLTIFLKKKCSTYLHEITEFPFVRKHNGILARFVYNRLVVPRFDKIFVISTALKEYLKKYINPAKIEIINMFIELERFNKAQKPIYDFEYIAYCGSMNTDKDGVPILIESFARVIKDHPNLKLVLIGDIKNRPIDNRIVEKIKKYNLADKLVFTGFISSEQIPRYLKGAKLLALARPSNIQAKGGFPTKLGEYLATEKPVVVTGVGDIPKFIIDGKNGFLSEPNAVDFSKKILELLEDYNKARGIGISGKELAEKQFNYKTETKKLTSYIDNYNKKT